MGLRPPLFHAVTTDFGDRATPREELRARRRFPGHWKRPAALFNAITACAKESFDSLIRALVHYVDVLRPSRRATHDGHTPAATTYATSAWTGRAGVRRSPSSRGLRSSSGVHLLAEVGLGLDLRQPLRDRPLQVLAERGAISNFLVYLDDRIDIVPFAQWATFRPGFGSRSHPGGVLVPRQVIPAGAARPSLSVRPCAARTTRGPAPARQTRVPTHRDPLRGTPCSAR